MAMNRLTPRSAVTAEEAGDDEGINLRSLRQMEATIDQIVLTCGQCAVYKFSNASNEWERKEIEGSMFVVSMKTARGHSFAFVVINRLNTTNMLQTIDHNFDINITIPYLLYKNSQNEIFCIWFYNENDCRNFSEKLQNIIDKLSEENSQPNPPNDILQKLFQKAPHCSVDDRSGQRIHTNGGAVPRSPAVQTPGTVQLTGQRLQLNPLDLFSHTTQTTTLTTLSTTYSKLPDMATDVQNLEDALLSDLVTPAMLMDPMQAKPQTVDAIQQPFSHMTVGRAQPSAPMPSNDMFNYALQSIATKDKLSGPAVRLSMEQLKQTLIHLLQTDADFLHSIHSAYISAVSKTN